MSRLLIGTDEGVIKVSATDGGAVRQEGPPSAGWMAQGAEGAYAVTTEGALWLEESDGGWELISSVESKAVSVTI